MAALADGKNASEPTIDSIRRIAIEVAIILLRENFEALFTIDRDIIFVLFSIQFLSKCTYAGLN